MKIAIVGAGAIGGMIAAILAEADADPLLIARGQTLTSLREHGLTFIEGPHRATRYPRVTDRPAQEGAQDLVIIAVKAHQIESALPAILPLIGPNTRILTAINGMPWWFFQGAEGPFKDRVLRPVDPEGVLARSFDPAQLIGCGVYLASIVEPPYTVISTGVRNLVCGAVSGETDALLSDIAPLFNAAGLPMQQTEDIRIEVMNKLMGNIWANPVSVLTCATMRQMTDDPVVLEIGLRMMREFETLCTDLGITLPVSVEERMEGGRKLGDFRTSMLQDFDRGRELELGAILEAPVHVAGWTGTPCETLRMVHALTNLRAMTAKSERPA